MIFFLETCLLTLDESIYHVTCSKDRWRQSNEKAINIHKYPSTAQLAPWVSCKQILTNLVFLWSGDSKIGRTRISLKLTGLSYIMERGKNLREEGILRNCWWCARANVWLVLNVSCFCPRRNLNSVEDYSSSSVSVVCRLSSVVSSVVCLQS